MRVVVVVVCVVVVVVAVVVAVVLDARCLPCLQPSLLLVAAVCCACSVLLHAGVFVSFHVTVCLFCVIESSVRFMLHCAVWCAHVPLAIALVLLLCS